MPEIRAVYAIGDRTGMRDFQFFYVEQTEDGHDLPRYYF